MSEKLSRGDQLLRIPSGWTDNRWKYLSSVLDEITEELSEKSSREYVEVIKRRLEQKQDSEKPTYQAYAVHDGANAKVEVGGTYIAGRTFWDWIAEHKWEPTDALLAMLVCLAFGNAVIALFLG